MDNKKLLFLFSTATALFKPFLTMAINFPPLNPGGTVVDPIGGIGIIVSGIIGFIWPIFGGFAVLMFIYAGFLFLSASGDSGKVKDARQAVLWGMIGVGIALLSGLLPYIVSAILGL